MSIDRSADYLKGLRQRRVRRESAPEERESQEEVNPIPTVPSGIPAAAAPISRVMSNALKAWTTIMLGLVHDLTDHRSRRTVESFIKHPSTVLFLALFTVAVSAVLAATSVFQPRASICNTVPLIDDNFFSSLSQTILSIFSAYLILLPPLRARHLRIRYPFWFRVSLTVSVLLSITSSSIYPFYWQPSVLFGYVASLSQVIATLQLIEGVDGAVTARGIGELELDVH